jgi:putative copper resistance protein D
VLAVALLVGYGAAVRRAGTSWPAARWVSWTVGVLLLVWITCGGPAVYSPVLVAVDLIRLVALLLVVPTLLGGGAPLRLLAAVLPSNRLPHLGLLGRAVPALLLTLAAALLLVGTGLLRWSLTDPIGTGSTAAAALACGAVLVRTIGAPGAQRRSAVVVAALLLALEAAAALLLASTGDLLVADWFGAMGWGTDALAAQRGAAVPVLVTAVLPTVALLVTAVRSPGRRAALTRTEAVPA